MRNTTTNLAWVFTIGMGVTTMLLTSLAPACLAGPPFQTDDPEPVDFRHWEVYAASQYLHDPAGVSYTLPHIEINYGVAPDTQLHLIAPFLTVRPNDTPRKTGYGDTELGVKYRFQHETARRPQIGIFPLVEIPTGSHARGLGNGQVQFFLPVWLQKSVGAWTTYGGGGYWHNPGEGNRDWWFSGVLIQRDLSPHLTIGTEVFHTTPDAVDARHSTGLNLGAVINLDEEHHILLSGGGTVRGERRTYAYLAWQWTLGPEESIP